MSTALIWDSLQFPVRYALGIPPLGNYRDHTIEKRDSNKSKKEDINKDKIALHASPHQLKSISCKLSHDRARH